MLMNSNEYLATIEQVKQEIKAAQYKAAVHVNTELIMLYHSIGCVINAHKSWGNKFIENLAQDINLEFPQSTGYPVRNLKYMAKFAATYPDAEFVQQVVAQIPWGHNVVLLDKLGALKIEIYKTNEEYVKTIWGNTSNGLLSPRSGRYYSNTYTYEGTPGVSYYAVVTICAGTATDYDTREITTSTERAPY